MSKTIFVFGSNEAGRHGAGAAKFAFQHHEAIYGQGYGLQGNSFAIPTKDRQLKTLPLGKIAEYVNGFCFFAETFQELEFHVTRIGCGLAGYTDEQIAPMFYSAPKNCFFDKRWKDFLTEDLQPNCILWG